MDFDFELGILIFYQFHIIYSDFASRYFEVLVFVGKFVSTFSIDFDCAEFWWGLGNGANKIAKHQGYIFRGACLATGQTRSDRAP